jgi:hypothetical protein
MKNLLDWSRWKRVYENTETQTQVVDPFTTPMIDKDGKKINIDIRSRFRRWISKVWYWVISFSNNIRRQILFDITY